MGQLVGHMTGSALCFGIWLGDELGLYRTLAELGADERGRPGGEDGLQPAPRAGVARRPGRRRPAHVGPGERPLRDRTRGGDGAGRRRVAGLRRPGDERDRVALHRHAQGRRGVPGQRRARRGARTTRACSRAPSGSSAPATAPSCRTGSPPSTASPRSCTPGPASPTSAAATARRSSCSRRPSPRRTSPGSTSTPRRSPPPRSGRRRPACRRRRPSRWPTRRATTAPST